MLPTCHPPPPPAAAVAARSRAAGWLARALALLALLVGPPLLAVTLELTRFDLLRNEQGLALDVEARFELPPGVEAVLQKGVALHFVAEAELSRARWYWFDKPVVTTRRTWRLAYQPLTLNYRVSLGGLAQTYASLPEALRAVQRLSRWRVADAAEAEEASHLEFRYGLDLDQLPRPLLIAFGNQPEWSLRIERTIAVPPAR